MALADKWRAALLLCGVCGREWAAVLPALAPQAECPGCGTMVDVPDVWADIDKENDHAD